MHDTAYAIGKRVLELYGTNNSVIVDVGSRNINGTLRDFCPPGATYLGIDLERGPGVDVVYSADDGIPFAASSADIVLSTSAFEHDQFFWQTFLQMASIVRPEGVVYLNAPTNGKYHPYPIDAWRFYPDCALALCRWARRNGQVLTLIESFVAERQNDIWNDFVAIFKKTSVLEGLAHFLSNEFPCTNARQFGQETIQHMREASQDMCLLQNR